MNGISGKKSGHHGPISPDRDRRYRIRAFRRADIVVGAHAPRAPAEVPRRLS